MSVLKTNLTVSDVRPGKYDTPRLHRRISSNQKVIMRSEPEHLVFEGSFRPENSTSESSLVKEAVAGDIDAFRQLVAGHAASLRRTASAVLHNKQDAEEAVQDGLLSAYRGINSFEGRSRFSTWLTRIVVNSALMVRRRHNQQHVSLDEMLERMPETVDAIADPRLDPEQQYGAAEIAVVIRKKVGELPSRLQDAFRLHEMNGLSYETCARQLGIELGTLKSRVVRARRRLAHSLRPVLSATVRQPERLWFEN